MNVRPLDQDDRAWLRARLVDGWGDDAMAACGFAVTEVRRGAVDESRRMLKPTIPTVGEGGVPISDEIEMSLRV